MTTAADLAAAKALIADPADWCKGITRDSNCAMWALCDATIQPFSNRFAVAAAELRRAVPRRFRSGGGCPVVAFNDDPDTTHADVMALFDRAIKRASKASPPTPEGN